MSDRLKEFVGRLKNGKLIFVLGICGILLIFISSLFSGDTEKKSADDVAFDIAAYKTELEEDTAEIVKGITGSEVSVAITLDTGIVYNYADETKFNKSDKENGSERDTSTDSEKKYIILTDADGNEKPLVISEQLPTVRGVAVICGGSVSHGTEEKIYEAVGAFLDITSKRIYISFGGN